ncbi:MAG TPA: GDSL-type esterase/lipase family protein [Verrucomicrobiota bacterium]|nr:GDSL-type esterase/lipase family protein [Verrucomicrobiota bacterium]
MVRRLLLTLLALACLKLPGAQLLPLRSDAVVAFIGGAQMVAASQLGYLESALTAATQFPPPRFRDFSWEGDTVFARPRPLNFPPLTNQLLRAGATVAVVQFGQMESLAGAAALPEFLAAYESLIKTVQSAGPAIVLLTPTRFEAAGPLGTDTARTRNEVLALYVEGLRALAERLQVPLIDVSLPPRQGSPPTAGPTTDGVQLTAVGQRRVAELVVEAWGGGRLPDWAALEPVREAVIAKNDLWFRYRRPTNWAFLAGDRTDQPSSRDHRDRNIRWFPKEMEEYVPLIEAADAKIAAQTKEATR